MAGYPIGTEDGHISGLKKLVEIVHAQGAKVAIQLAHAGRKSEVQDTIPVAPSALAFNEEYKMPAELSTEEIQEVIAKFSAAARRAVRAGFDAIEIHGAHGYLINQFLSPLTNLREDEYGGSPENRVRFLDEVLEAIHAVIPERMPVIVRVSAEEYHQDGNGTQDIAAMLKLVKHRGIDLVNVSSGAVIPVVPRAYAGYQIPFALKIKEMTDLPVLGGGLITEAAQAMQVAKTGVDLVYLCRELLRNPYWVLQAAHVLGEEVQWPESYVRGKWL